jgi:metal-responsive CopG/Arc/MetJ family transcriptional regulator
MRRGSKQKEIVVTFKADQSLLDALKTVRNRSEFIRAAILTALESSCPLCGGSGVLTPNQRRHWSEFASRHPLRECDECHEVHLVCSQETHTNDGAIVR